MKVIIYALLILLLAFGGCSGKGVFKVSSGTQVDLSRKNYRVVKSNAVGTSSGFRLLGIIPFASPSYTSAMSDLYKDAKVQDGSANALVNVTQEESGLYLILFSIPKLTVRADIIEFTDESEYKSSIRNNRDDRDSGRDYEQPRERTRRQNDMAPEESAPSSSPSPYDRY
jgi:hypothetical protein